MLDKLGEPAEYARPGAGRSTLEENEVGIVYGRNEDNR